MSLLNVFKDFHYEDDDDHSNFFHDTLSQLLDDPEDSLEAVEHEKDVLIDATVLQPAAKKAKLDEFEEAYTVLKSIESAHHPISFTSINAYLHHQRKIETNKRNVKGLTWPERPQTFNDSRLLCSAPDLNLSKMTEKIPNLIYESDTDTENESEKKEIEELGLCEMSQSTHLHNSLLRTIHSIYNTKTFSKSPEIDPRLAHSIARRTAFLLQSLFTRSALNRRSALRVLSHFPDALNTADVHNVPANWQTVEMAAEQLVGQAALDQETFDNFSSRLEQTFK